MADDIPEDAGTETVQEDHGGDRVDRLEDKLDGFITWVKDALGGGSRPATSGERGDGKAAAAADIASEVQRGVERVRTADQRKQREAADTEWRAGIEARVGKLENPEKPPSELNPVGRRLWGDPDS